MSDCKVKLEFDAIQWDGHNYKEICDFVGYVPKRDASQLFNGEPSNLIIDTGVNGIREVGVFGVIIKDNLNNIYVWN